MGTFWDVLGINPTTDTGKIRKAYSALIKVHNPEDDPEEFKKINSAYKAAVKFARQFSAMGVTDDQIKITDVRPDGSFGIQLLGKDGKPFVPNIVRKKEEEEIKDPEEAKEALFDFDSIDSSVVKDLTPEEINEMSGMLSIVPGFNVPDSEIGRAIKTYLNDELNIVNDLAVHPKPEDESRTVDDAITIATAFLQNDKFNAEKILWQVYFLSPMIRGLGANLIFYRRLEMLINNAQVHPRIAVAISNAHPSNPRVYIMKEEISRIDFLSKVPFRYKEGEYPDFDNLMKKEKKEEVDKLIKFLETTPIASFYGLLMPSFWPSYNNRIADVKTALHIITTAPFCKEMLNNRLLWKLFFRGKLVSPIVHKDDLHTAVTKTTLEVKLPREVIKIMKKEIGYSETCFIRRRKDNREWYYLQILKNDIAPYRKSEKETRSDIIQMFVLVLGVSLALLYIFIRHLGL